MRVQTGGYYSSEFGYAKPVPNFAVVIDHREGECANGGYAPNGLCLHKTLDGAEKCLAWRQNGGEGCRK